MEAEMDDGTAVMLSKALRERAKTAEYLIRVADYDYAGTGAAEQLRIQAAQRYVEQDRIVMSITHPALAGFEQVPDEETGSG